MVGSDEREKAVATAGKVRRAYDAFHFGQIRSCGAREAPVRWANLFVAAAACQTYLAGSGLVQLESGICLQMESG
jgi:hypothetical protein